MTINAINTQAVTPDINTQALAQNAQFAAPKTEGDKAADNFVNLLTAGITGPNSMNLHELENPPKNPRLMSDAKMMEAELAKLSPEDQKAFLANLINRDTSGELDKQIGMSTFDLGKTLGAVQLHKPEMGSQLSGHMKDLFETGKIDGNDVKSLFDGKELSKGMPLYKDRDAAQGLAEMAKSIGNDQFSQAAMNGLLGAKPEGPSAAGVYEAAQDVAQDALNRGEPKAAFDMTDKLFKNTEMRDDMFKKLGGENSEPLDGRSGMLSLVNDLDARNKANGDMDAHFGGKKTGDDRLENIWQGAHKQIGGDTDAVRESNQYFANNVERLNWESKNPGGSKTEADDGTLISDYVQNVLLDETVDADKVGREGAINAITSQKQKLLDKAQNGATEGERLEAAGDLGNLAGSVGSGMDGKFKEKVKDSESAAEIAGKVGGAIIDSIPIVGKLSKTLVGEFMKKDLEDRLKEGMKPEQNELFDGIVNGLRADLPQASDRITAEDRAAMTPQQITQKEAQNRANAELHKEYNVSANEHKVRLLENADD